jgi:carbon monoxide dehydrogenase subunit G
MLWAKLRDAAFLAESVPEAVVEGTPTRDQAACSVHPGFAFIRGTLDVTLEIVEAVEPSLVRVQVRSKGVGSNSVVEAVLRLSARAARSEVHWSADVLSLGGLLKMVPPGLIRGAAQKVIEDVWTGIAGRL